MAEDTKGYLWVEAGEPREGLVAEVAPLVPVTRTYSFAVPLAMEAEVQVGRRVRAPLGKRGRLTIGFVVGIDRRSWDSTLRPIDSLLDGHNFLTNHLVELGREIARHYACPLGRTLQAITPQAVRREAGMRIVRHARLSASAEELLSGARRISAPRKAVIETLASSGGAVEVERLLRDADASPAVLRAMVKLGWVEVTRGKAAATARHQSVPQSEPGYELNEEQQAALDVIYQTLGENRFRVILLHGVSGSGKTEVYIHAMRRVLAEGRQAVLLVPEIVLTTQLVGRLLSRFPDVAVNHSGLTDAQRSIVFRQVESGEKTIVIGTRSAVFAPCPNLGLICVDEEQEPSYKNPQTPRFHVRDAAVMRAKLLNIPVILGSATPSLEIWYRSEHRSDHVRLVMRHRVKELPMPKVHLVDMRDEFAETKTPVVLSRLLERLLSETLHRGEQALILMNRRGFANRVFCPSCKMRLECPNCKVGLVVHTASGETICHYCRLRSPTPTTCPVVTCGARLEQFGLGTQKVEEALAARFPTARLRRVDSDTMRHRTHYQTLVDDFADRKIDLLVGTQMIAKGLDFPAVSLVGVIQADATTLAVDFRAQERLFQLITQVAGRAGRADVTGRVVVQTLIPDLPALAFALRHDYESFATAELRIRERVGLPPFRRLARIVLAHRREETVRREAEALTVRIREATASPALERTDVLGPHPCALARLRGRYRYDLLLRTPDAAALRRWLGALRQSGALRVKAVSLVLDVDPVSLA